MIRDALLDYAASRPGSNYEQRAVRELDHEEELREQARKGDLHPLAANLDKVESAADVVSKKLAEYEGRAHVRATLADYLERTVLPLTTTDPKIQRLPEKLRGARQRCWSQLNLADGRTRVLWDRKAGEPLLCPDDAREEAQRLKRRLEDEVGELGRQGLRVYYAVLTIENPPAGKLAHQVERLWGRFRQVLKQKVERSPGDTRPKKALPRRFPIEGAIAVLEAPLAWARDWHPHLNVILVTRGRLDWADFHRAWHWVCQFRVLKPGNIEAAFRELIKYSTRAVPEKSAAKALGASPDGAGAVTASERLSTIAGSTERPPPPPMVEWTAAEWLEWWSVMKGRRRTRTYGELYGLGERDEKLEDSPDWVTIGRAAWSGARYLPDYPLLRSIPGDKSLRATERLAAWRASLQTGPPTRWAELRERLAAWRQHEAFRAMSG